jgi:hypothetical protein
MVLTEDPAQVDRMNADGTCDLVESKSFGEAIVKELSDSEEPVGRPTFPDAIRFAGSVRQQLQDKPFHGQRGSLFAALEFPVQTGGQPDWFSRAEIDRMVKETYMVAGMSQRGWTDLNMETATTWS